jgi:hypothetical protein
MLRTTLSAIALLATAGSPAFAGSLDAAALEHFNASARDGDRQVIVERTADPALDAFAIAHFNASASDGDRQMIVDRGETPGQVVLITRGASGAYDQLAASAGVDAGMSLDAIAATKFERDQTNIK